MDKQTFGLYIAEKRKQLGMTQAQLAQKVHVTDKAVSKWERGLSYPDVTLLEPLAQALCVSLDQMLRCRMSTAEEKEQPMAEETKNETLQTSESVWAMVEMSKDAELKKRRDIRRLSAALVAVVVVVVVAAVLIVPRSIREYRAQQEQMHFHTLDKELVEILYVERAPGSERPGEYLCCVDYNGTLLSLYYYGGEYSGKTAEEIAPPDRAITYQRDDSSTVYELRWAYSYCSFTYDDRTNAGEISNMRTWETSEILERLVGNIPTEQPLFGLENTCLTRGERESLYFYQPVAYVSRNGDGTEKHYYKANIFFRLPRVLADKGYTIADCDGDGINELLVKTGWEQKPLVVYDYVDGGVVNTWYDDIPDWAAAALKK